MGKIGQDKIKVVGTVLVGLGHFLLLQLVELGTGVGVALLACLGQFFLFLGGWVFWSFYLLLFLVLLALLWWLSVAFLYWCGGLYQS